MTDLQARLLALIATDPGCWTAATLAAAVDPPRFDRGDYLGWAGRKGDKARGIEPVVGRLEKHRLRVQRALSRLQQSGLVERQRPARLAPWARERLREMGPGYARFLASVRGPTMAEGLDWPGDGTEEDGGDDVGALDEVREVDTDGAAAVLLRRLDEAGEEGLTTRELLGPCASGATRRAYTWLCKEGVIEAPSLRWPTAEGMAVVRGREGRAAK